MVIPKSGITWVLDQWMRRAVGVLVRNWGSGLRLRSPGGGPSSGLLRGLRGHCASTMADDGAQGAAQTADQDEQQCIEASPLAGSVRGPQDLRPLIDVALEGLRGGAVLRDGPCPSGPPSSVSKSVLDALRRQTLPVRGVGSSQALADLTRVITQGTTDPANPLCSGHLHCPPLAVAVAADLVASTLNASLDSWDQGPSSTDLEPEVIKGLAQLVGYDINLSGGAMTTGGTESNFMGLLLARDSVGDKVTGTNVALCGLGDVALRMRVFCSEKAHFSVRRTAAQLGIGENAVVTVPTDAARRMIPAQLAAKLDEAIKAGLLPIAVVATAGTTDFGSIDPLAEVVAVCAERGVWIHVDAAYGGGCLFSDKMAPLLAGIEKADSVALDLHKIGWQPIPAGVFLVSDRTKLRPLIRHVAYLNPADDDAAGYPSLLGNSLRTTRRVDAFKIAVTIQSLGRRGLGALVDRCYDLAVFAAEVIEKHPLLELAAPVVLTSMVFRFGGHPDVADEINAQLRRRLMYDGVAVVGRTEVDGTVWLKLTLLNPHTTHEDIHSLINIVCNGGVTVALENYRSALEASPGNAAYMVECAKLHLLKTPPDSALCVEECDKALAAVGAQDKGTLAAEAQALKSRALVVRES